MTQAIRNRDYRKGRGVSIMGPARIGAVFLVCAMASLSSHGAHATDSVVVVGDQVNPQDRANNTAKITQDADQNAAQLKSEILEETTALTTALQNLSGQMTINQNAATQAQSRLMDTWDARETQRRITDWRMRGAIASNPSVSVCNVITGSVTARDGFNAANKWQHEILNQQLDFFTGSSPNTAAANGAAAAMEQRNSLHCQVGATAYDIATGLCPAGTSVQGTQAITGGGTLVSTVGLDLNANSLLEPANLTMSAQDKMAANAFILHAFDGNAIGAMPNNSANSATGRQQAAMNMTSTARNSVAQAIVSGILADRAAMPGTGGTGGPPPSPGSSPTSPGNTVTGTAGTTPSQVTTTIAQWAEQTAESTIGYQPSNNFPDGISRIAYLKLRAMAWFWNPNWVMNVGKQNVDTNTKDIALIQAYAVYQNWELYQQVEKMNLTLATMLSIMEAENRFTH